MPDRKYDILLTLSTHRSQTAVNRFLESLHHLGGENVLPIIVAPEEGELREIRSRYPATPAVYIQSDINSLHFGRAWGFVWAVNNGISARYLCSCDDDLAWNTDANLITTRLDQASQEIGFSMMGFASTHPIFAQNYDRVHDDFLVGFDWLDGNCIFTHWNDNLQYGVLDATTHTPLVFFVEIEYSYRMRLMTGRPIIFDNRGLSYDHLFRRDPHINAERATFSMPGIIAGNEFWRTKFGIDGVDFQGRPGMANVIRQRIFNEANRENFSHHLLFDGEWNNWKLIYQKYLSRTKVIDANI